jgi:hypothetical protein
MSNFYEQRAKKGSRMKKEEEEMGNERTNEHKNILP